MKKLNPKRYKIVKPQTQIIHFIGGVKRTIHNVVAITENEMCKIVTLDGRTWLINKNNVLCVEIIEQNKS